MDYYKRFVMGQLEEALDGEYLSQKEFDFLKDIKLNELSEKMTLLASQHPDMELEEELTYYGTQVKESLKDFCESDVELHLTLKSRIPMPHLRNTDILQNGVMTVGGFGFQLGNQFASIDWDNTIVTAGVGEDDHFFVMARCMGELTREVYENQLNEDDENRIPYEDIYSLETLYHAELTEVAYEAYKRDYDGDIVPMDVHKMTFVLDYKDYPNHQQRLNCKQETLNAFNESDQTKWRLEGIKDPKHIHDSHGTYNPCLA